MSKVGARSIGLLGVPLDLGAGRRGTDMGPSAIRIAGLTDRLHRLGLTVREDELARGLLSPTSWAWTD